jgi:Trk K+ transport system NAD-binding subunit
MDTVLFLVLRRMRTPLLVLSALYTIAVLGMVMVPGVDDQGNPWRMDFFHAFYFVSFMGTTIGFGELPYEFSEAQRMWATVCIYLTVVAWIYAIGSLLALAQNDALRRAFTERRFARAVRSIREPFHLLCGYGDTGSALIQALEHWYMRSVAVEIRQERVNVLSLENYPIYVPALCGDAGLPGNLLLAGVTHPHCAGVVALTDDNKVNLHVAITAKVLNPSLKVICRADSHDVETNMASFGTEHIIDPFDTFAERLATALHSPCQYLLIDWLAGLSHKSLADPLNPPRGLWVLCGFGRFGRAVYQRLKAHRIPVTVIVSETEQESPPHASVVGRATQADTLEEANVREAVGIVAGTEDDSDNLSIIMTARELNADLFVVLRQNQHFNKAIFDSARADVVMEASRVVAEKIRGLLTMPMVEEFLPLVMQKDNEWACVLISRLAGLVETRVPEVWEVELCDERAYGVCGALRDQGVVRLRDLLCDPGERTEPLAGIPLLLARKTEKRVLPDVATSLEIGDRILFAGSPKCESRMQWNLQNRAALTYVCTGRSFPQTYVWRWINRSIGARREH